jgi:hypothetical protein
MSNVRNREASLWQWLKDHRKELRPLRHDIQRIENGVGKGTPDVEGCIDAKTFWCELKIALKMKGDNFRIHITGDQVRKALRRENAGGRSWVLIRICGDTWRDNRHYLIAGKNSEELMKPISRARLEELSACQPHAAAVEILKALVG